MTKKMILIAVFFFLTVDNASGRGFMNNPDRYPSVGMSLGVTNLDGTLRSTGTFTQPSGVNTDETFSSDSETKTSDFTIDLRLPVSHQLTLFGSISVLKQDMVFERNVVTFGDDDHSLSGFGFRLGARYYFNR